MHPIGAVTDELITQEILDIAVGSSETQAVRDFALGKTRSQFAKAIVARLEIAVAESQFMGTGVVSYSINGQATSRSLSDAMRALAYFRKLASSGRGMIRQLGEFCE